MNLQKFIFVFFVSIYNVCSIISPFSTSPKKIELSNCYNFQLTRNFKKVNLLKENSIRNFLVSPFRLYQQRKHISCSIVNRGYSLYYHIHTSCFEKKVLYLKAFHIDINKMQKVNAPQQTETLVKGKKRERETLETEEEEKEEKKDNRKKEETTEENEEVQVKIKKKKEVYGKDIMPKHKSKTLENEELKNYDINEEKDDKNNAEDVTIVTNKKISIKKNIKQEKGENEGSGIKKTEKETNKKKSNIKSDAKLTSKQLHKKRKVQSKVNSAVTKNDSMSIDSTELWNDYEKNEMLAKKTNVFVGAHISALGGVKNAPSNSFNVAGMAFALFLRSHRTWFPSKLTQENIEGFEENCKKYKYDRNFIVPHAPYLINLASADISLREKSYATFLDDLKRCELLNIKFYNIHPGSTTGKCSIEEGIKNIADCINKAHIETQNTIILLENEAGRSNCVGSTFEQLRDIINQIHNKDRIGVCFDTCHAFAAGYDIRTEEGFNKIMMQFDEIINLKYLKAVHLNDSKGDLGCRKDRHENIGKGKLTTDTFKFIMNSKYFKNMPIILETPDNSNDSSVYKQEIAYMYSLAKL